MRARRIIAVVFSLAMVLAIHPASAQSALDIHTPGRIKDNHGTGVASRTNYAPTMVPAFLDSPTILRSQISERGGYRVGGSQCNELNFVNADGGAFDWYDTYCENRGSSRTSLCPKSHVHQGLDMVGGTAETCRRNAADDRAGGLSAVDNVTVHAVADGEIGSLGKYTVRLNTVHGLFRYLHLNMKRLAVKPGDVVRQGDVIGFMSRDFGGHMTTYHLHLELWKTIGGRSVPVPLYYTYAAAQARHEGRPLRIVETGEIVKVHGGTQPIPGPAPVDPVQPGDPVQPVDPVQPADPVARMVSSYWRSEHGRLGLIAQGPDRVFILRDGSPDGLREVYFAAKKLPGDVGAGFYQGMLRLDVGGCGPVNLPFGGPIVDSGLGIELSGFVPAFAGQCEVTGWTPRTVKLRYVRKNESFDQSLIDLDVVMR